MNSAPASTARSTVRSSVTVPAPMTARAPIRRVSVAIASRAPGTVIVISITGSPASTSVSATRIAISDDGARTTGITPALSDSAAKTTAAALAAAKKAGLTVSYDLNFRSKLWDADRARAVQEPLMEHVDVLITTEEDARVVFGVGGGKGSSDYSAVDAESYGDVARELQKRFDFAAVAITLRENPLVWRNTWSALILADGALHQGPRYDVEIVDRIGAGDAFSAGLIFGRLECRDWKKAVDYGTALSALKHTVLGDFSVASRREVEQVMAGGSLRVSR